MAAFLMLDATDPNGTYLRKTVINVDSISRIVSVGANCCRVVMRESPSEDIYVAGTLKGLLDQILGSDLINPLVFGPVH
jgi:hypothetical protein